MVKRGWVFKGLKPVNWCFDCASALAEAEVEYQDKASPAIDVGFPSAPTRKVRRRLSACRRLPRTPTPAVIWTTTPWTIPPTRRSTSIPNTNTRSSRPTPRPARADRRTRRSPASARFGLEGTIVARTNGGQARPMLPHPFYDRLSPVFVADTSASTPAPASCTRPRPMAVKTSALQANGFTNDDILSPVQQRRHIPNRCPSSAACTSGSQPGHRRQAAGSRRLFSHEKSATAMHCWRHKTPLIYRATAQWFVGMDLTPDGGPSLRELASAASKPPNSSRPGARRACTR